MATKVKICGLVRREDAELAVEFGADYLGFVLEPTSPRRFSEIEDQRRWLERLDVPKVAVYGVFNEEPPVSFDIVQAYRWESETSDSHRCFRTIRFGAPDFESDAIVSVRAGDALVIDSYHPTLHGGSGIQVDWTQAASFVASTEARVILAGGLTPENVAEAIALVRPFGVDVSSGIEASPGIKDRSKMKDFIDAVRGS